MRKYQNAHITVSPDCPYSLERCEKECKEVAEKYGCDFNIPVHYSKGETQLGCCRFTGRFGFYVPVELRFSQGFFSITSEEQCRQILLHEMAHYIATYRTGQNHGHDSYFKEVCDEIGCTNKNGKVNFRLETQPKYQVVCSKCGHVCASTSLESKALRWHKHNTSGCCRAKLLIQPYQMVEEKTTKPVRPVTRVEQLTLF